jgi:hypothetical protein
MLDYTEARTIDMQFSFMTGRDKREHWRQNPTKDAATFIATPKKGLKTLK